MRVPFIKAVRSIKKVIKVSTITSKAIEQAYHCADETLLALISQKDVAAFEILYDRHAYTVFNLLMRITRDAGIAEELLQATFWQIWQKVDQFEGSDSAVVLLLRMARNKAVDHLRCTLLQNGESERKQA